MNGELQAMPERDMKNYWWYLAFVPCLGSRDDGPAVMEGVYIVPSSFAGAGDPALTYGQLLTKNGGVKHPRRPRPGEMLLYGNILYAGSYTASVKVQQQRGTPIEMVAMMVLRGANDRSASEINSAFRSLGLGSYSHASPLLGQLRKKGWLDFTPGSRVTLRTRRGQEVSRAAPGPATPRPDPDLWHLGYPTEANGLSTMSWWEIVDWPRLRGGRPKGSKNKNVKNPTGINLDKYTLDDAEVTDE